MPKYIATRDTWLSHECRLVKAGTEFETTFPAGMKLGENISPARGSKSSEKKDSDPDPGALV